ncbi:MAG: hypothetical protein U1E39_16220 [Planctomycetota bacterium]
MDGTRDRVVAGDDWVVRVRRTERAGRLTRAITTLRRAGHGWRCTEETHVLALFRPEQVLDDLVAAGFVGAQVAGFGRERFPAGLAGFVALKPQAGDARPGARRGPRAAAAGRATDGGGRASRSRSSTSARVRGARR